MIYYLDEFMLWRTYRLDDSPYQHFTVGDTHFTNLFSYTPPAEFSMIYLQYPVTTANIRRTIPGIYCEHSAYLVSGRYRAAIVHKLSTETKA
jgi:hypothetical protein